MPEHRTDRALELKERNQLIVRLRAEGFEHNQIAKDLAMTTGAVEQALRRARREAGEEPTPSGRPSSRRAAALAKSGYALVSGWIPDRDRAVFDALVAKGADEVERVTKGEGE